MLDENLYYFTINGYSSLDIRTQVNKIVSGYF